MRVGQRVMVLSEILRDPFVEKNKGGRKPRPATVVYIHPKKYFFTVEYQTKGGAVRECFRF